MWPLWKKVWPLLDLDLGLGRFLYYIVHSKLTLYNVFAKTGNVAGPEFAVHLKNKSKSKRKLVV